MYVGHVGIALGLRAQRDAPPLWLLVASAQGCDWGDTLFYALGLDTSTAYGPHGLLLVAVGMGVAGAVAIAVRRDSVVRAPRTAGWAAAAYGSHWVVDCVTGRKPTIPGGPAVGLAWYGHPGRDLLLEGAVVALGWASWWRALPPPQTGARAGRPLAWALLAALLALQLAADLVLRRGGGFL